jgi:hypothetical protein
VAAFAAFAAVSRDTGIRIGLRGVDSRLGIKLEDELGFWFSQEGVSGIGNQFAANSGAGPRDLMARMSHDSTRAAMIYQKSRELHQLGEKLQVSRSQDRRNSVPPVLMPAL